MSERDDRMVLTVVRVESVAHIEPWIHNVSHVAKCLATGRIVQRECVGQRCCLHYTFARQIYCDFNFNFKLLLLHTISIRVLWSLVAGSRRQAKL